MKKSVIYVQMMNRFLIGFVLVLMGLVECAAQNKMSYNASIGASYLNDQSSHVIGDRMILKGGATYWVNSKVGVGSELSHTDWTLVDFGGRVESSFYNLTLPISLDFLEILGVESRNYRLIMSGGPGVSRILSDYHEENVFSLYGSINNYFYVYKNWAINLNVQVISNISQHKTFGGTYDTDAEGITSVVSSIGIGIAYKPKWPKVKEPVQRAQPIETTVNNTWKLTINNYVKESDNVFTLFFDHDKDSWDSLQTPTGNTIELNKIVTYAKQHAKSTITLTGYASNTKSIESYDFNLADRRVRFIERILRQAGLENEISLVVIGKDLNQKYHPLARAVLIEIKNDE